MQKAQNLVHWADNAADRIIRKCGEKDTYTVAAGITPSGPVHFGNFREVITADFVACALRDRGKKVRFIYSWDDFDTFRKVPAKLPSQEELQKNLFCPITEVPDPYGKSSSYAAHFEESFEEELKRVGISPEFLYQAKKYCAGEYSDKIALALNKAPQIAEILNAHRKEPLKSYWLPVGLYCHKCRRDDGIENMNWDGVALDYHCRHCQENGREELNNSKSIKLPWRIDWPMRWSREKVDFEPGGKDHSSEGGSFTTSQEIVKLFDWQAPVYLHYDFVALKGTRGKMSSSSGEVVTLSDVLKVYSPEMVRWMFARHKPNLDFEISFDLDVIKTYEDFDRQEQLTLPSATGNPKKIAMAKRVFRLSQVTDSSPPYRPAFRHLTNILQIYQGDLSRARKHYANSIKTPEDRQSFDTRAACALYWLENFAPPEFKFCLNQSPPKIDFNEKQKGFLSLWRDWLDSIESLPEEKQLHQEIYRLAKEAQVEPKEIFPLMYKILIDKSQGPRLANLICLIGKKKVSSLLGGIRL